MGSKRLNILKEKVDKIIALFLISNRPVSEIGIGIFVGIFWALTPLVGIQILLVLGTWFIFRLFRINFFLPGAMACVWITNPLTLIPFYFGFYFLGFTILRYFGYTTQFISYASFSQLMDTTQRMNTWDSIYFWLNYIYEALLWPMGIGSLLIAVPTALFSYFFTVFFINYKRRKQAQALGLTLLQWEEQFVYQKSKN